MKLEQLLEGVPYTLVQGSLELDIEDIIYDSRKAAPGRLFVCIVGTQRDSHDYAAQCAAEGVTALVVQHDIDLSAVPGVTVLKVESSRYALALMSGNLFGNPSRRMTMIGVTGTNGKTTCAYLLEHLYRSTGRAVGVMGTVSYRWPGHDAPAPLTAPGCLAIHENLAAMRAAGVAAAVMEVSSHALDQRRVAGLSFAGALFTNLTQDHLDYHGDMERYFEAKRRLFLDTPERDKAVAINADDAYGRRLLNDMPGAAGYGLTERRADRPFLAGELLADTPDGLRLRLAWRNGSERVAWELASPLVGRHNAANLMAVMT